MHQARSTATTSTVSDDAVAAGTRLDVNANRLHAGESQRFDGLAKSDGAFRFLAGTGDDILLNQTMNERPVSGLRRTPCLDDCGPSGP